MRLDVADVTSIDLGTPQSLGDHLGLSLRARYVVGIGMTGLINSGGEKNRVDVVPIGDGPRQRLDEHGADPLAGNIAVAGSPESMAVTGRREERVLGQGQVLGGVNHEIDATDQSDGSVPGYESVACQMKGSERRRTHRVQRQARSGEVEEMGDSVGHRRRNRTAVAPTASA